MKNARRIGWLALFVAMSGIEAVAQTTSVVQPKIMVIPYVKQAEDIRTLLEDDVNKRITLTKIKEAFDSRGFTTVDFIAKLKAVSQDAMFKVDNQTDIKSMVIENSGADVYVEAEMNVILSGSGNAVRVIVTAYEISTGNSLSNKIGDSGKFYTDDIGRLASKAIESCADDFLNTMQVKFSEMMENGRSIMVNIGFDQTSELQMSSDIGSQGLQLTDEIQLWMEEHAYRNNYHIQGTTDKQMIFDDVRIPLRDPNTGNNYNISRFGLEFLKFARSLGLQIQRDIKGNTLYITIK